MLAGVGGATVEEAQERMSYAEFVSWVAYARKRGGLSLSTHLEDGFGLVSAVVTQLATGKPKRIADFKPKREEEAEADIMVVYRLLSTKARETAAVQKRRAGVHPTAAAKRAKKQRDHSRGAPEK